MNKKRFAHNRISDEEITKRLSRYNFKLIDIYSGADSKHRLICFCGNEFSTVLTSIFQGLTKSCGCLNHRLKEQNKNWKGCGELSGAFFSMIRRNARNNKREFKITVEEIWELFLKQNRKCALSGLELVFSINNRVRKNETTASLDRIDPSKGYELSNVRWVHKDVNYLRHGFRTDFTDSELLFLCENITKTLKGKEV